MDALQRGLSRPIPLEKAASYFVGIKTWQPPSPAQLQVMKQAAAQSMESPLDRFRKIAAENEEPIQPGAAMSSPTPAGVPEQNSYLTSEAQGLEAENNTAVEYYQQLLDQLRGEVAQAQQTAQDSEARAQQLEAAQAEHDSQLAAAQQEGQIAQQAAMQQVQSANLSASTAMQQAVDAENRALQAKMTETTAKLQQQQLRSQLLELAAQGLPGTEPALGEEGNAAGGMEAEPPPAAAGAPDQANAEAAGGQEATAAAGPGAGGLNQQGQPANAEGMPGQEASTEQPGAAAPGTQLQPAGDSSGGAGAGSGTGPQSNTDGQPAQPEQDPTAKRQGQVSIKVGSFGNPRLIALLDRLEGEQRSPLAVR
jgi:hypothetical protein